MSSSIWLKKNSVLLFIIFLLMFMGLLEEISEICKTNSTQNSNSSVKSLFYTLDANLK